MWSHHKLKEGATVHRRRLGQVGQAEDGRADVNVGGDLLPAAASLDARPTRQQVDLGIELVDITFVLWQIEYRFEVRLLIEEYPYRLLIPTHTKIVYLL